ncbi:hypothetical protein EDB89DRAFT_1909104 [Lactarius sanguifluus]|nr:hypothetical protein EDB89DRAFT_1909104 [Lactarius sanguifluus]
MAQPPAQPVNFNQIEQHLTGLAGDAGHALACQPSPCHTQHARHSQSGSNQGAILQHIEQHFNALQAGMNNLQTGMNNLQATVNNLEVTVNNLQAMVNNLEVTVNNLEMTVDNLEMTVNNLQVTVETGQQLVPMQLANAVASIDAHLRFPPNIIPQFPLTKRTLVSLNAANVQAVAHHLGLQPLPPNTHVEVHCTDKAPTI